MNSNQNMILAIGLSLLIIVVWQFLVIGPRMEEQRQAHADGDHRCANPGSLRRHL